MDKYCVCIKNEKRPIKTFEDIRPGKIILLRGINDHILISHPSYSNVYQYEDKNRALQRDK